MATEQQLKRQRDLFISLFILTSIVSTIIIVGIISKETYSFADNGTNVPFDIASKMVAEAEITDGWPHFLETKAEFFSRDSLDSLTSTKRLMSDPAFRVLIRNQNVRDKEVGISLYFAHYTKEILEELNRRRITNFSEQEINNLKNKETILAIPSIMYSENQIKKILQINPNLVEAKNLGKLCPDLCPENDYFYIK